MTPFHQFCLGVITGTVLTIFASFGAYYRNLHVLSQFCAQAITDIGDACRTHGSNDTTTKDDEFLL